MGGKKKRPRGEKRNECVGRRRCCPPPTLSAHCTRDLRVPTGRRRLDGARSKEKKLKTGIRRLLGEKKEKKRPQEELLGREAAAADGPSAVVVGAFDRSGRLHQTSFMRPSSSHTYTHTREGLHIRRGRHTITALLFSSLLSSQCACTEINKRPKKTGGV